MTVGEGVSRRAILRGGALSLGGALAGAGAVKLGTHNDPTDTTGINTTGTKPTGTETVPFHGEHQAGIETPPQAHAVFLGFDLRPGVDRPALGRMMRLLTDDARRLTSGAAPLGDTEPDLTSLPARLTITFGFGPGLFTAAGRDTERPPSVKPLPAFTIDRLRPEWTGGDFLIQICADDPLTVTHAQRMLVKDTRAFATLRWAQRGFRRGRGIQSDQQTQRNVLGQIDGTINPKPGTDDFTASVWSTGPDWFRGGTTLVLRRVRVDLERWDAADSAAKEFTIGRRLHDGSPLTGTHEADLPDLAARNDVGLPVIAANAHVRLAHVGNPSRMILRRPYNFDEAPSADGVPDTGLIFASYQADVDSQFLPLQRALAERDLLNQWTTPIGSAVFALPPGCEPNGWIGESLLV